MFWNYKERNASLAVGRSVRSGKALAEGAEAKQAAKGNRSVWVGM